jgi:hypothetical protein
MVAGDATTGGDATGSDSGPHELAAQAGRRQQHEATGLPAASQASTLKTIVSAAKAGRVSPRRAREWARRAARGEDISILARLEPAVQQLGEPDVSRLTNAIAGILASGDDDSPEEYDALYSRPADDSDASEEYDALYSPADHRHQAREAAAAKVLDYTEDEVYALLFSED